MGILLDKARGTGSRLRGRLQRGTANRPVMEEVERRRMMTTTISSWSDPFITDLCGSFFGGVSVGDNGYAYGYPTVIAGADSEPLAVGYNTWDGDTTDGFDSGDVDFQMAINADGQGGGVIEVGNSQVATFAASPSGNISQVTIQAAVDGGSMLMAWKSVAVYFYHGGQIVDTATVADFSADTMQSSSSDPAEAIVSVRTDVPCDGVRVVGKVRLAAAQGTQANASDIFGQVVIS